jgi:acetyl esterase/lipase
MIAAAGAGATLSTQAADPAATHDGMSWTADPSEVLRLWPGAPPGSDSVEVREETIERPNPAGLRDRIVRGVRDPRVTVFRPRGLPRGALLLLPGGGYRHVVVDKEGFETARWLAERGIAVFVLFYRLPADGWSAGPDAPLQDAQRAMRLLRLRASTWDLDPRRLGVVGFSAGGHLAARLASGFTRPTYAAVDAADGVSARPALAGLMYPVIAMDLPAAHAGSREQMLGPAPSAERVREYSADTAVGPDTPPTFILHAGDDTSVPVENSQRMAAALRAAGVPVDLHVFAVGGHGFGLRAVAGKPVAAWPQLFLDWLDWQFTHAADSRA